MNIRTVMDKNASDTETDEDSQPALNRPKRMLITTMVSNMFAFVKKIIKGVFEWIKDIIGGIKKSRTTQPHLYLLYMVIVLVGGFFVFQWIVGKITSTPDNMFSKHTYSKALDLGMGKFNLLEQTTVDVEKKSFNDYFTFFASQPYKALSSLIPLYQSTSTNTTMVLAIISAAVLPVIATGYAIWFLWKFGLVISKAILGLGWTVVRIFLNALIVCPLSGVNWNLKITHITPFKKFVEDIFGGSCTTSRNLMLKYLDDYIKKPFDREQKILIEDVEHKTDYIYEKYFGRYITQAYNDLEYSKQVYVSNVVDSFLITTLASDKKFKKELINDLPTKDKKFIEHLTSVGKKYIGGPMEELVKKISTTTPFYNKYIATPRRKLFSFFAKEKSRHPDLKVLMHKISDAEKAFGDFL